MVKITLEVWVRSLVERICTFLYDAADLVYVLGVKNPIRIARAILEHSQVPDPLGRIPPLLVVSR